MKFSFKNKKFLVFCCCLAVLAVVAVLLTVFLPRKIKASQTLDLNGLIADSKIELTAHRGLSAQAPENTIPAVELAGDEGYKYVEFDIQLTKDGQWILSHDEKINRMTNGRGKISDYTYFELAKFSIDNGANYESYPNLKMPSLDDALDACLKKGIIPMIEVKNYTDKGLEKLKESIINHGFESSCYVISFKHEVLEKMQKFDCGISFLYLVTTLDDEHLKQCLDNKEFGVSFKAEPKKNTKKIIEQLLEAEIELFCWTVDDSDNLKFYNEIGVNNFVTNRIVP